MKKEERKSCHFLLEGGSENDDEEDQELGYQVSEITILPFFLYIIYILILNPYL